MAEKGYNVLIKFSVDGSTWYTIDEINSAEMNMEGENIDITKFSQSWINRIQGLKDSSYSLSGFYDSGDTNGQVALRTAFINDSDAYLGVLYDGTNGWEQKVKISNFNISAEVNGSVELSIEAEGTDAISTYST